MLNNLRPLRMSSRKKREISNNVSKKCIDRVKTS
jgi:hypothetical protein